MNTDTKIKHVALQFENKKYADIFFNKILGLDIIKSFISKVRLVLVPELSIGQLKSEIIKYSNDIPVIGINKLGGTSIQPKDILNVLYKEIAK